MAPEEAAQFADDLLECICVEAWDTMAQHLSPVAFAMLVKINETGAVDSILKIGAGIGLHEGADLRDSHDAQRPGESGR